MWQLHEGMSGQVLFVRNSFWIGARGQDGTHAVSLTLIGTVPAAIAQQHEHCKGMEDQGTNVHSAVWQLQKLVLGLFRHARLPHSLLQRAGSEVRSMSGAFVARFDAWSH